MLFFFTILTVVNAYGFESTNILETLSENSFEKNLPLDIKVKMIDLCLNPEKNISKEATWFWSTLPIKILSITPEFHFLNGTRSSIIIEEEITAPSCPPLTTLNGTFTSMDGKENKYQLEYNGDTFTYQINNIFPPQYNNFIDSPLKQFKVWNSLDIIQLKPEILMDVIQCKDSFVLISKYNNHPACVKPETKEKMIERGWTTA